MYSVRDELIFWFDQPPKVGKGAFNYISEHWGNKVYYICCNDFSPMRKRTHWDDGNFGAAKVVLLSEQADRDSYVRQIFETHPDAVHVLNGFGSSVEKLIRSYCRRKGVKLAISSEKPSLTYTGFKRQLQKVVIAIKYRWYYQLYKNNVQVLLPLGTVGKKMFVNYGWDASIVFPAMYCPVLEEKNMQKVVRPVGDCIKFLYVGRFNFRTRALDVLMKAIDLQDRSDKWHLDIVGGYGENKNEVIEWANNHPNVSYLGTWPSDTVGERMADYDVYLVPTRSDGWNAQTNEALLAGIPVITTDEAVSDEMIRVSGAGMVVRKNSVAEFAVAIRQAIEKPREVEMWKMKAIKYHFCITPKSVGEYLIHILDHIYLRNNNDILCPWLEDYKTINI